MDPLADIPSSLQLGLPATFFNTSTSEKWNYEVNPDENETSCQQQKFSFLNSYIFRNYYSGQHHSACVSATRQHKGNKEKLGAKPTERINKPNKTEINDSESFQVQTTAVM